MDNRNPLPAGSVPLPDGPKATPWQSRPHDLDFGAPCCCWSVRSSSGSADTLASLGAEQDTPATRVVPHQTQVCGTRSSGSVGAASLGKLRPDYQWEFSRSFLQGPEQVKLPRQDLPPARLGAPPVTVASAQARAHACCPAGPRASL